MLKRLGLILFFLAFLHNAIWACSYAYQYSYFPLGKSGAHEWLFLHLVMERNVNTPENSGGLIKPKGGIYNSRTNTDITVRWTGKLHLMSMDSRTQQMEMLQTIAYNIDIDDKTYEEELLPYFEEGMALARQRPNFEPALLETIGYCRHDNDCNFLKKEIDEANLKMYWTIEGYTHKALSIFPQEILEKFAVVTHSKVEDMQMTLEPASMVAYFMSWKPYSIRLYKVGNETLFAYSIGRGRRDFYASEKAKNWQMPSVGSVEAYIEGNDILYHGQRFDFFYLPKQP